MPTFVPASKNYRSTIPIAVTKLMITLFMFLCWNLSNVNAQQSQQVVSFPSPTAASLGTYGDIPVAYYTGVPDISIPFYDIKLNNLTVPIKLSYHTHNVKPELHPGWTGMGWSVLSGGAITRIVHRRPDEHNVSGAPTNIDRMAPHLGYYYNYARMDTTYAAWKDAFLSNYSVFSGLNIYDDYERSSGTSWADYEPDEFHFSFLNYSGVFYLNQKGQWQVRSDSSLKVTFDGTFVTPFLKAGVSANYYITNAFNGFTITDAHGTQYIFGTEE